MKMNYKKMFAPKPTLTITHSNTFALTRMHKYMHNILYTHV